VPFVMILPRTTAGTPGLRSFICRIRRRSSYRRGRRRSRSSTVRIPSLASRAERSAPTPNNDMTGSRSMAIGVGLALCLAIVYGRLLVVHMVINLEVVRQLSGTVL